LEITPRILDLKKIIDPRGNLSIIEQHKDIPFDIARAYWIYDVPGGQQRGGHAYKKLQEFIVALSGSFDIILSNGEEQFKYTLNRSYYGLYIPKMFWRHMENFSTNSVGLILSDCVYSEGDYIRDFEEFKQLRNG
jgi:WxcM-like, C-terminal